jgi:hypothetical protein
MKNQKIGLVAAMLVIAAVGSTGAFAEGKDVNKELDGFGLLGYKVGVMDKKPIGLLHSAMGIILWDRWYLGAEVSSLLPASERRLDGTKQTIEGGYGGLLLGIKLYRSGSFLLGFQNTSGVGAFKYRDVNDVAMIFYYVDSALFGEWDVTDRVRLGLSLGNRVSYSVKDAPGMDADMWKGPFVGTYVRIGTF